MSHHQSLSNTSAAQLPHHHQPRNTTRSSSSRPQLHQPQLPQSSLCNHKTKRRLWSTFWSRNQKKPQKSLYQPKHQLNPPNQKYTSSNTRPKRKVAVSEHLEQELLSEVPPAVALSVPPELELAEVPSAEVPSQEDPSAEVTTQALEALEYLQPTDHLDTPAVDHTKSRMPYISTCGREHFAGILWILLTLTIMAVIAGKSHKNISSNPRRKDSKYDFWKIVTKNISECSFHNFPLVNISFFLLLSLNC